MDKNIAYIIRYITTILFNGYSSRKISRGNPEVSDFPCCNRPKLLKNPRGNPKVYQFVPM